MESAAVDGCVHFLRRALLLNDNGKLPEDNPCTLNFAEPKYQDQPFKNYLRKQAAKI